MGKFVVSLPINLLLLVSLSNASYSGPFLFWGMDNMNDLDIPTLQAIDDKVLRDIYSGASSILVFIRNATTKLNYENFPRLSEIIGTSEWLYLPQSELSSDPLEYNVNAEVFVLTGPVEQQDVEIAALYRDAQVNYGKKNILGILAMRYENIDHSIYKRQVNPKDMIEITSTLPVDAESNAEVIEVIAVTKKPPPKDEAKPAAKKPTTKAEVEPVAKMPSAKAEVLVEVEAVEKDLADNAMVYGVGKDALLYTTEAPILKISKNQSKEEDIVYVLQDYEEVTIDDQLQNITGQIFGNISLDVKFKVPEKIILIKFVFLIGGKWSLQQVEVKDANNSVMLTAVRFYPSGPYSASYACEDTVIYRHENHSTKTVTSLLLQKFQVQPMLQNETRFSKAYDCVGPMTTPPIVSGIFITSILGFILAIGLTAIWDIKSPNKFETRGSMPLTFSVQE